MGTAALGTPVRRDASTSRHPNVSSVNAKCEATISRASLRMNQFNLSISPVLGDPEKQVSESDSAGDMAAVCLTNLAGSQLQVLVHSAIVVGIESWARCDDVDVGEIVVRPTAPGLSPLALSSA